jgi:CBS domain containing-hemolysin-like protein
MDFITKKIADATEEEGDEYIHEDPDNIWIASSNGDIARVQQLLGQGTSVNGQDVSGYSPMYVILQ